jgi:transposase
MILGRVILAPPERRELQLRARGRAISVESVRRAKVILVLAGGSSYSAICAQLGCTDRYTSLWKERFQQERLGGLDSRYRGAEYRRRTAQTEARILELTRSEPTDGSTHWSSYRLAKEVGVSQSTVSRVWRQFCTASSPFA